MNEEIKPATPWQPIGTVDKSKDVLIFTKNRNMYVGRWCQNYLNKSIGFKVTQNANGDQSIAPDATVTHWMPLPESPL